MKIWMVRVAIAIAALVAALAAFGYTLPVHHEASRSADFQRLPQDVYALVSDYRSYPDWWPVILKVEVINDAPGGATFREHQSDGPIVMTVVEQAPPARFVTRIDDPDQPFGGTWTFEITPTPSGSRLTITERGEIYNPIFRALARLVFGYTGTMDSFLTAAQRRLIAGRE